VLAPYRSALATARATRPVRLCFAAAHVVMRESYRALDHSLAKPGDAAAIAEHVDWAATLGIRMHLIALGFGIAEAMDTAQRFFLGWPGAERLIRDCGRLRPATGWVAGAGTDHLPAVRRQSDLVDGVVFQAQLIQSCGGIPMLLPMPWLSLNGASERDYVDVYTAIVRQLDGPLFVHWLGDMFLPALRGYFPGDSFQQVLALDPARCAAASCRCSTAHSNCACAVNCCRATRSC